MEGDVEPSRVCAVEIKVMGGGHVKHRKRGSLIKKRRSDTTLRKRIPQRHTPATLGSERQAQARNRARRVLGLMRRKRLSLAAASQVVHIKPATVVRYVGSALRQDKPGSHYRATKGDRFRREAEIPTPNGPITVPVYGIKRASEISRYLNAVGHFLRTGDERKLRPFKNKTLKVGKQRIKLLTDPSTLSALADAGLLRLDFAVRS